jgi:NADPH:quinone reductase-like Zn-dependent oxidoreductase
MIPVTIPPTMQALAFRQHGTLDAVAYTTLPVPTIRPHEVLVAVQAAALNRLDLWVLQGWPGLRLTLPHIMGSDGAGVVVATGSADSPLRVGDRVAINPTLSCGSCAWCQSGRDNLCDRFAVIGEHAPGLYAQYAAVPARNLLPLPDDVSFETAAAASLVGVTAWHMLIGAGQLRAGEDVLIVGAGGGVNTMAVQIARLAGARRVIVVGSSDEKLALSADLGADLVINRHREEWPRAVWHATGRRGVDIVVDNVGAATFPHSLRCLAKGGRLLTVGNTSGPDLQLDNRLIFGKHLSIIGSTMGSRSDYARVMALVFAGRLRPVIDRAWPLHAGIEALRHLADGDVQGKLLLHPAGEPG